MDNGSSGFITLTELQERLNVEKRQVVRDRLRAENIHFRDFGNEALIAVEDIVGWIKQTPSMPSRRGKRDAS